MSKPSFSSKPVGKVTLVYGNKSVELPVTRGTVGPDVVDVQRWLHLFTVARRCDDQHRGGNLAFRAGRSIRDQIAMTVQPEARHRIPRRDLCTW